MNESERRELIWNLGLLDEDRLNEMESYDDSSDCEHTLKVGLQDIDRISADDVFEYLSDGHQIGDNVDIDSVIFDSVSQRLRKIEV